MNKTILLTFIAIVSSFSISFAKDFELKSPDGKTKVRIDVNDKITWSIKRNAETILQPSQLALFIKNGINLGINPQLNSQKQVSHDEVIVADIPVKSKTIIDHYNELKLDFKGNYSIYFRAYNDGVAYRFETNLKAKRIEVENEIADFDFGNNNRVFWAQENDPEFLSHFESLYKDSTLNSFNHQQHAALPMLIYSKSGVKMLISEADLYDYPNMFLFGSGNNKLTAGYPKNIAESTPVRDRGIKITKLETHLAKTSGKRKFPWRSIAICDEDKDLLVTNLTYKLSSPSVLNNPNWVKPGKVAWDWWNDNNIYGVDFKAGINTKTYQYYIDFASKYGLEYIMLDEGWTKTTTDLTHTTADINIQEIIDYGKSKNVGVWLWTLWGPLDKDMDHILALYKKWGAVGIKVDFMARADQYMVNFYERVAATAAKYELMVDLHGAYKPVGLNHKYPNVLSYEGVRGLENNKWSTEITPTHNVTLPFIRMAAGPMDYTPGAMINATKKNFNIVYSEPMSMGTRAHQVAMYVMYESPLQMLADNPSNYLKDSLCTRFIAQIPTVWDETIALDGKVGEYAAIARKNGNRWFISAMTNWDARSLNQQLSFLDGKTYRIDILSDGINADRHAADYKISSTKVNQTDKITIKMEKGGGWCAVLTPID
ncbi:glycoside hydrolase family 97 protein [Pedobacter sp. MC2016-05]|uniref:glycoside hydrolase family 97 protein n=1 Tax=Pedobacter sp. MC2016-05 TaxID=2994474 RepID=UPI00224574CF|nr:glycoside hydrolase family 97 protein [Pedobacter sp. MC2016-05]MCX2476288.1 glycoside hydrolase family 97 protein [Pedobacter sp. MC2016-05]